MKSNSVMVPEAKEAMERFKNEAASEVGVSLKQGYNGDLTSRQAGSIGGQMVKKMIPIRTLKCTREDRTKTNHTVDVNYSYNLRISHLI